MASGGLQGFCLPRFSLKRLLAALLLVLAAVAAHVLFWYVPRERPAAVDADSLPGRLLLTSQLPYRLWLPYPHQNLGRLESAVEDADAWVAAVSRLLGSSATELPRFGPFRFPPAKAMTVASDSEGERSLVAVSVYPTIAVIARLAGRIAGNPLLVGGEVSIDDRPFFVRWQGSTWLLGSDAEPEIPAAAGSGLPEALSWLLIEDRASSIPPGRYHLLRRSGDLSLSSFVERDATLGHPSTRKRPLSESVQLGPDLAPENGPSARPPAHPLLGTTRPSDYSDGLLAREWAFLGLREGSSDLASWMLLLRQEIGGVLSLPDGAVLYLDPRDRWSLPGEDLARFLDLDMERGRSGPWGVVAMGSRGRAAAEELGSALQASPRVVDLEQVFWVRPSYLSPMVEAIREVLAALPVVSRSEVQYWSDLTVALEPLVSYRAISLEVDAEGRQAELRLWSESPWLDAVH